MNEYETKQQDALEPEWARLLANGKVRWHEGILASNGNYDYSFRVRMAIGGRVYYHMPSHDVFADLYNRGRGEREIFPIFQDIATHGWLIELARESWGGPVYVVPASPESAQQGSWLLCSFGMDTVIERLRPVFDSELGAWMAAIDASPDGGAR